ACEAVAVNWNAELRGEHGQTADMVEVLVRDENAMQIFRRAPNGQESLADLFAAETGIDQQAGFVRLEVGAVAIRTAAEDGHPCQRHVRPIKAARPRRRKPIMDRHWVGAWGELLLIYSPRGHDA